MIRTWFATCLSAAVMDSMMTRQKQRIAALTAELAAKEMPHG